MVKLFPMKQQIKFSIICLILSYNCVGQIQQDTSLEIDLSGYVNSLQNYFSFKQLKQQYYLGLIHHRLNLKVDAPRHWEFYVGLRDRLYIDPTSDGLMSHLLVNRYPSSIDLSTTIYDDKGVLWYLNIDRLYLAYEGLTWQVRVGRQRINWGIALFWNPNDLFNTYNFTDFDYIERPGVDAVYLQYSPTFKQSYALAYKIDTSWTQTTIAARLKYHIKNYDIQFVAGKYLDDIALGAGWAGAIGGAGFKGEFMNFIPLDERDYALTATVMTDYMWKNGFYTSLGVLYNSSASADASLTNFYFTQLSARNLYPFKYTTAVSLRYPINPILSTGLTSVYSFDESHPFFLSPEFSWNIGENWDLTLLGQWFFYKRKKYSAQLSGIYLRFKWNY